jgi:hypothetical protein
VAALQLEDLPLPDDRVERLFGSRDEVEHGAPG